MAKCHLCGAATELYLNGVPICLHCEEAPESIQTKRPGRQEASTRFERAKIAWQAALAQYDKAEELYLSLPTGNPDGSAALRNANRTLSDAAQEYKSALRDYVRAGGTAARG